MNDEDRKIARAIIIAGMDNFICVRRARDDDKNEIADLIIDGLSQMGYELRKRAHTEELQE